MGKRHDWITAVMGAVAIGMLAAGNLRAQPGPETKIPALLGNHPILECFLQNLGKLVELRKSLELSQDQKRKIAEIFKSRKPEIMQIMRKLRADRRKVLAAVRADTPDETAIRATVTNMNEASADAAILWSRIRREAMTSLTPRQRGQVDRFLANVQSSTDEAFAGLEAK